MKKLAVILSILMIAVLVVPGLSVKADYSEGYFHYRMDSGSVTITDYFGREKEATIPKAIGGYPVNAIASGAFQGVTLLKVYVPSCVTVIPDDAFDRDIEVVLNYDRPKDYVLSDGTNQYETLKEALKNCPKDESLFQLSLLKSFKEEITAAGTYLEIGEGQNVEIDLNGYTVTATDTTENCAVTFVKNSGSLKICDSKSGGQIVFSGTGTAKEDTVIENRSALEIEDAGIFSSSQSVKYGVHSVNATYLYDTTFTLSGTVQMLYGDAAVYLETQTELSDHYFTMNGGSVLSADSAASASALLFRDQTGETISHILINGGGISAVSDSMRILSGNFTDIQIKGGTVGGDILIESESQMTEPVFEITGGRFSGGIYDYRQSPENLAAVIKGGVYAEREILDMYMMEGLTVSANTGDDASLYPWTVADAREFSVLLSSRSLYDETSVSLLQGGGYYHAGTEVTVSAEETAGYLFSGWAELSGDGYEFIPGATELQYSFTAVKDVKLAAVYRILGEFRLSVTAPAFSIRKEGGEAENYQGSFDGTLPVGKYTITYTDTERVFEAWQNENRCVVSKSSSYTMTLNHDTALLSVTTEKSTEGATVLFCSAYKQLLKTFVNVSDVKTEVTPFLPAVPNLLGKTAEWFLNDGVYSETALQNLISGGEKMITVIPRYTEIENPVKIILNQIVISGTEVSADDFSGSVYVKEMELNLGSYGQMVVTEEPENTVYLGLYNDRAELLATGHVLPVYPMTSDTVTLYAVFTTAAAEKKERPISTVAGYSVYPQEDDVTKHTISVSFSGTIPKTVQMQEAGILYANETLLDNAGLSEEPGDAVKFLDYKTCRYKYVGDLMNTDHNIVFMIKNIKEENGGRNYYFRGYIRYLDEKGNEQTVYSPLIYGSVIEGLNVY